jgi:branched-chain amino acid transport system substrate-binding protein
LARRGGACRCGRLAGSHIIHAGELGSGYLMSSWDLLRRAGVVAGVAGAVVALAATIFGSAAAAADGSVQSVEVAVALPLSGDEAIYGERTFQGIQLAIDEANAEGVGPRINVTQYDDRGNDDAAKEVAEKIVASRAMLVLGPSFSTASLAAGPTYAAGGVVSLAPTATADTITRNATTFRVIFKNSEQGETLAFYLTQVLGKKRAAVIVVDNGYGRSLQGGFEEAAKRLGIDAQYFVFKTADEAQAIVRQIAADTTQPPVVFCTLDGDAERMLTTLRRLGGHGPVLGGDALGDEIFSERFVKEPEERKQPGFFTDGVHGISPMILDSANADTLAFAERFRARYGRDPVWQATAGYDAARLAVATVRGAATAAGNNANVGALRAAAMTYLKSLNSPTAALQGLLGPIWFDETRGRQQAIRIGRFNRGRFESAPLQIVPVATPNSEEVASRAVFEVEPGRYARVQRVVYSGLYLNEIARVDVAQSKFTADLYLWVRYAGGDLPGAADPTDIDFPDLVRGSSDGKQLAAKGELDDGTTYRLWRIRGDFNNDYDLHRYPADRQTLAVRFFNTTAASDRIVYVQDRRSADVTIPGPAAKTAAAGSAAIAAELSQPEVFGGAAAATAFRNLTQWDPLRAGQRRDILVTSSALGDPRLVGAERVRELSGFNLTIELRRRVLTTLAKTLLPLGLMALIMYASLYFPVALVKEKVTVAITGALSGAVLLTSINAQLGNVGYVIAVEYGFYVFFGLCLLCIIAVLAEERFRAAGRTSMAAVVDRSGRILFATGFVGTVAAAWMAYLRW